MAQFKETIAALKTNTSLVIHAGHIAACLALLLRKDFTVEIDAFDAPAYFLLALKPCIEDGGDIHEALASAKAEVEGLFNQFPHSDEIMYETSTYIDSDSAHLELKISLQPARDYV